MSWKVENIGKRCFVSKPSDFVRGGELNAEKNFKLLPPGKIAEVTDAYGKILDGYKEIRVLSRSKTKE